MRSLKKMTALLAFALASAGLARSAEAHYFPPPESQGGWRTLVTKNAAPTAAQKSAVLHTTSLDPDALVDAWNYVESLGPRQSLVVIRRGWIVGEWDKVGVGPVNSCTKSLTGLALAKLFELSDAGRLPKKIGYDGLACKYLPASWSDADPRKKLIKVRSLPTMSSGLEPMDMGLRELATALALPVVHPTETIDQYSSASVMLEGLVIEDASGQRLSDFFRQHFSEPIGAESVRLWDAKGAAGWAFMQTRDLARFGYLMLREGAWDDGGGHRQLLRPDLVAKCRAWPAFLGKVADGPGNNGRWWTTNDPPSHFLHTWHGWWINWSPAWPHGMTPVWPFVPADAFWMSGFGKDICVVIPSLDLVIAHQTARGGGLEQKLNEHPEFFPTLLSKIMAARFAQPKNPPQNPPAGAMTEAQAMVERWDTHEWSLCSAASYANPFKDVEVTATFTHGSGKSIRVDGFHDGGWMWKIRFMPTELGQWAYTTSSRDAGLSGKTGTLSCVAPTKPFLHGPLRTNGHHFVHVDGTPRYVSSTRLSCQFAAPSTWPPLIALLKEARINRVLFMVPGVSSNVDLVNTQRNLFAPGPDYTRFNVEAFRAVDAFIDTLRQADILASPYFYYDPSREIMWKMNPEQDRAYLRYGMARFGAFSNVMPVLGNEIELKTTDFKDKAYDLTGHAWVNEMGAFLKSRTVFGQPVTVHNPCYQEFAVNPSFFTLLKDWPFAGWTDFMLKQTQIGATGTAAAISDADPLPKKPTVNERAFARRNQVLINLRRFNQPVIDEEPGYDMSGTRSSYNALTPDTMRPTLWTAATAGAYTMWGSKSTYVTGDPIPKMLGSLTPQYLRVYHDVMTSLPYADMEPHNEVVTPANVTLDGAAWRTNFALAQPGEAYLVYSLHGGNGTVTLTSGRYAALRIDPRDGSRHELNPVDGGAVSFSVPPGDWVLTYRRMDAANSKSAAGRPWRPLPLVAAGKVDPAWAQVGWGGFSVDGGALRTEPDECGMGLLLFRSEKFGDCQIRVVYRCEKPKSNAGIFVRLDDGIVARIGEKSAPAKRDALGRMTPDGIAKFKEASEKHLGGWYPVHHGYEVQIMDATDALHRTGAIYSLARAAPVPERPQSEWRTMIIALDGECITVDVDDKRLSSFDAAAANPLPRKNWTEPIRELKRPTHGYLGLQNHDPGDVVWFKDISVRPLSSSQ